jgi:hypothetical protein
MRDGITTGIANIAMGISSLGAVTSGACNVGIGRSAMNKVTSGVDNIAFGTCALGATTIGCHNVAIGCGALKAATTSGDNRGQIAIGEMAMGAGVVTGSMNIAIGCAAGAAITSGYRNVFVGRLAGNCVGTGFRNVAMGECAYSAATTGCFNIAIGAVALGAGVTTGINNVAIGCKAGNLVTSGHTNVFLGENAGQCVTSGVGHTLVGREAGANSEVNQTTGSYSIALGNHQSTNFYATIALTVLSDKRDKTDVADLDLGLDYIKALRPVYYRWDKRSWYDDSGDPWGTAEEKESYLAYEPDGSKKRARWEIGLLAQEVLAAEKLHTSGTQVLNEGMDTLANEGLTVEGTSDTGYQLQYQKIIMPLIKAAQELSAENIALAARVTDLEAANIALAARVTDLE